MSTSTARHSVERCAPGKMWSSLGMNSEFEFPTPGCREIRYGSTAFVGSTKSWEENMRMLILCRGALCCDEFDKEGERKKG